jgi:WD40 repeat protein
MVWLLTEDGKVDRLLEGHSSPVHSVAFNATGRLLATGGWDIRLHIWDLDSGTEKVIPGSNPVAWNPLADELAYGRGTSVRLWTPTEDRVFVESDGDIYSVAWTPDGNQLTTGDFKGHIRHWNRQGKMLHEQFVPAMVFSLAWHPTRALLASTSAAETNVRLWDREFKPVQDFSGHSVNIVCARWSPDGRRLVSGGGDGSLRIWDENGKSLHDLRPPSAVMHGVCFSPDGRFVAGSSSEGRLSIYQTDSGEPQFVFLPFIDKRWLSFSAAGAILDGELQPLQDDLIVLAELSTGQVVSSTVPAFRERFPAALRAGDQR